MNVSYRWLKACANRPLGTPGEIEERLAARGFPVESVTDLSAGIGDVVVGRVEEVTSHPNADRLRICRVAGGEGVHQVVCGAPNVAAGGCYPFAPVGARLPSGMRIRRVKIRGERSEGMLCSEAELDLGPGGDGILALEGEPEPGQPLARALGIEDLRFDVEITPNRSDLLSHLGLARELSPGGDEDVALPPVPGSSGARETLESVAVVTDTHESSGGGVTVRIEEGGLCHRYIALRLSGIRVGPSPLWLERRLRTAGARPINNVVDATNYVLLELGQPLHAFDLKLIAEQTIVVRRAREGEGIETLDRVERMLAPDMLAICDPRGPIAIAGVIGGAGSEVSHGTTEVLLECALFQPASIRSTRKTLGLSTDASYRFERGVDPEAMRRAIGRAAEVILATAGGEVAGPLLDTCARRFERARIRLRPARVEQLLGVPFEPDALEALLRPLGLRVRSRPAGHLSVEVPGYRSHDLTREVDLIEEVARTHGYDNFPDRLGAYRPGSVPDDPQFRLEDAIRDELTGAGLLEAQVPAFTSGRYGSVEISNPVSSEEAFLRSTLLPGLIGRLEQNLRRGNRGVRLFEIGTIFLPGEPGGLPVERTHVAVILHGTREPAHWSGTEAALDLWDVKGLLERLAEVVASPRPWEFAPAPPTAGLGALFHPRRAFGVLDSRGTAWGVGGGLNGDHLDLPKWSGEVWGIELTLPEVPGPTPVPAFRAVASHPSVDRDLALLVPEETPVKEVLSLIRARGERDLREVEVFDLYRGDELPEGTRSVAVRVRFRAADRTLKDEEVEASLGGITLALEEALGVRLRTSAI